MLAVPSSALAANAVLLISTTGIPAGALVGFDTDSPSAANLDSAVAITGTGGERILAIDLRGANGVLYGISEASRLYAINPVTGSATQVGAPGATTLDPFVGVFQGAGFDFDPVTDLLRVTEDDGAVNGQDDNFSVNSVSGVFTQEGDLGGAGTDVDIAGVAYTNAFGATQTTLYGIETNQPVAGNSRLVVINPPAAGTLTTQDSNANGLGLQIMGKEIGFEIIPDPNRAFATFQTNGLPQFALYRIDLGASAGGTGTGDATLVGVLGSGASQGAISGFRVRGFALAPPPPPAPPPVPPPPAPTGEQQPQPPDTTAPLLSALSLSPGRFRAAARGPSVAARVGGTVSYGLSEDAAVSFRGERALPGRRVRGRCVAPKRSNRRAKRCTRYKTLRGSFTHQGKSGRNSFKFTGRLRARKLPPGRYRLRALATDPAGNRSRPQHRRFQIVRR